MRHQYHPQHTKMVLLNEIGAPCLTWLGGMVAQCVALLSHSKKVVGSSPAWCNMSGLVPGPFCVEFACSPRVHPGSPHRTPQQKHAEDRTGHLDLVPGRHNDGCPLLLAFPGGGRQDGKNAEETFHRHSTFACVCVCVCRTHCVCSVHAVWLLKGQGPLICMFIESELPKELWTYAVQTAAVVRNRCFNNRTKETPYLMLTGRWPNLPGCKSLGQ